MKKFLLVLLRFFFNFKTKEFFPTTTTAPLAKQKINNISFFIVAHTDDIELFMGKEAQHQILNPTVDRLVFITLSAGDANRKNRKKPFRKVTWWQARELAHTAAIAFWNGFKNPVYETQIQLNQKSVTQICMGDRICLYNFRLTDADKTTSLSQLVKHETPHIIDLGNNQAYQLDDIQKTLLELLKLETQNAEHSNFYIMDCDSERNPKDHKDHQATSLLVLDTIKALPQNNKKIYGYLTYSIHEKPVNLTGEDGNKSFETWKLMGDVLEYNGYKRNDDDRHMLWVGKQYPSFSIDPNTDEQSIEALKHSAYNNKVFSN